MIVQPAPISAPIPPTRPDAPVAIVAEPVRVFGLTKEEFGLSAAFLLMLPVVIAAARSLWRRVYKVQTRSTRYARSG